MARSGTALAVFGRAGWDNTASSLRMTPGSSVGVAAFSEPYYAGKCAWVAGDVAQINDLFVGNDNLSSLKFLPARPAYCAPLTN